ncbi:16S rRNA (guanine(527)-N(7))-methyltransferase RsmG [Jannaschia seohaensis]|uniref:Ribosomal RNA small subunit methyltransferase G n=1 Tax=Jannaschia seohaensis TaxID=475081 RepID=A0A2Y9A783_9RHOB|nr:16S rRNA (guanine(527)-N(7))-methyltransferase RsmG [Jannaschia seohaensis]PWJ21759.1 16S rRNA (guanine527-N7)-methyltransferase [Jannaschia seohaensis]SSA38037.1 16S rRNA (guanine527-N7)-methyltransferase [Jannaschia seohaensis]
MTTGDIREDVSRETLEKYVDLLIRWNPKINLIAPGTVDEIWTRHIEDSLRVVDALPVCGKRLLDLGSGGGLPGIPIAIMRPDLDVSLLEADARKAAFLQTVRRELGMSYDVRRARIEAFPPHEADIITARALAPLVELLRLAVRHGKDDTVYIFPKGLRWQSEVEEAKLRWTFNVTPKTTERAGAGPVLVLENVKDRP